MYKTNKIAGIVFFYLLFIFSVACTDSSDCRYIENRKVKMAFAKSIPNGVGDTTVSNVTVIIPANGFLLYDSVSANQISLNLSQNTDSAIFIMTVDSLSDTLLCYYTRRLEMVSAECGFNTRFFVDSILYTRNNINYIQKLSGDIDKDVDKNFRIVLFKPKPDTTTITNAN